MSFDNYAIKIDNISKCYQVYDNPLKRLKEFIIPTVTRRLGKVPRIYHDEFWALQDVSFILKKRRNRRNRRQKWFREVNLTADHCGYINSNFR